MISTFPETRSGWLRADLIGRVQPSTGKPVHHVVSDGDGELRRRGLMESASVARRPRRSDEHDDTTGRRRPTSRSRVEAQFLGMLLFIISEIMLFGAFFTAYFFIRVVGDDAVAGRGRASCRWRSPA